MAVQEHIKSFSLADLKVGPITADDGSTYTPGSLVDVPGIQSCQVTIGNEAQILRGDSGEIAVVDQGNSVEFQLTEGGIDLSAAVLMLGGTMTEDSGTRQLDLKSTDKRPYFVLVGQALSDDGAQDIHVCLFKAKLTGNVELTFQDNEFLVPQMSGRAVGRAKDAAALTLIQHETPTDGVAAVPSFLADEE